MYIQLRPFFQKVVRIFYVGLIVSYWYHLDNDIKLVLWQAWKPMTHICYILLTYLLCLTLNYIYYDANTGELLT